MMGGPIGRSSHGRAAMDKKAKTPQKPKTAKPKDKKAG
jgi:hypothetical protein